MTLWGEQDVSILRRMWTAHSAAEIALLLGPSFTRNAVIGKAYRLGLPKSKAAVVAICTRVNRANADARRAA